MPAISVESSATSECFCLEPLWNPSLPAIPVPVTGVLKIGSSQEVDFTIPLAGVADCHCEFEARRPDRVSVRPSVPHPVWINDDPIHGEATARTGDQIAIGPAVFRIIQQHVANSATQTPSSIGVPERSNAGIAAENSAPAFPPIPLVDQQHHDALRQREAVLRQQTQFFQEQQRSLLERQAQFDDWVTQAEQRLRDSERRLIADRQESERQQDRIAKKQRETVQQISEAELRSELIEKEHQKLQTLAAQIEADAAALESERAQQEASLRRQTEEVNRLRAEVELKSNRSQSESEHLRQECSRLQTSIRDLESQLQQRTAAVADTQAFNETIEKQRNEIQKLEQQLKKQQALTEQISGDDVQAVQQATLQAELEQTIQNLRDELQQTIVNAESDRLHLESQVDDLKSQLERQLDELLRAETHLQKLEQTSHDEKRVLEERLAELQDRLEQQSAEFERIDAAFDASLKKREAELNQRSADLADKESELRQREQTVHSEESLSDENRALEERLAQLQDRIEQQSAEFERMDAELEASLQQKETELNARALQLTERESELQQREQDLHSDDAKNDADLQIEREKLAAAQKESEQLRAENEEYSLALQELKTAFESARDELETRQKIELAGPVSAAGLNTAIDHSSQEQLQQLRADLEAAEIKLANNIEERENRESEISELKTQLEKLTEAFQAQQQELEHRIIESAARPTHTDAEEPASESLDERVQQLNQELDAARQATDEVRETLNGELDQHRSTIARLAAELETARAELDTGSDPSVSAEGTNNEQAAELIAELTSRLQEQQQMIERLTESGPVVSAELEDGSVSTIGEAITLHKELDERTVTLDSREEELNERKRLVENQEAELESQRRDLLEARQQLELARAEIHSAIDPVDQQETTPDMGAVEQKPEVEVRSEFAELFGIDAATIAEEPDKSAEILEAPSINLRSPTSVAESDLPAIDDYSQEASAAVSISFGSEASLLQANQEPDSGSVSNSDEQSDADAAVADYMEKLLARSRTRAGENVVEELNPTKSPTESTKASQQPQAETKPALQQKSFIDAYMSGEYAAEDATPSPQATYTTDAGIDRDLERPSQPRAKLDLDALRNNMDSFRELSTKSVENALASHARRQEQGGLQAMKALFSALVVVSVFVIGAAIVDVIPFGWMTWAALIPTAVAGGYLAWKSAQIRERVRQSNSALNSAHSEADYAGSLQTAKPETALPVDNAAMENSVAMPSPVDQLKKESAADRTAPAQQTTIAQAALNDASNLEATEDAANSDTNTVLPNLTLPADVAELLPQIEADSTMGRPVSQ